MWCGGVTSGCAAGGSVACGDVASSGVACTGVGGGVASESKETPRAGRERGVN